MALFLQIFITMLLTYLSLYIYEQGKNICVTKYSIKEKNLDDNLDGLSILQVSDLQSDIFGKDQSQIRNKIEELEVDLIVITGDFIDRNHTRYDVADCTMSILLEKKVPVFFVEGNHETRLKSEEYRSFINRWKNQVIFLFDESKEILIGEGTMDKKSSIVICGISQEIINKNREYNRKNKVINQQEIVDEINDLYTKESFENVNSYKILLAHEPQLWGIYKKTKANLIFAGHAHGGQFRLPIIGGLYSPEQGIFPKFTCGVVTDNSDDSRMVISRGLGNSTFPIRIGNRPELVDVELKK